jgi:hypothetical protein
MEKIIKKEIIINWVRHAESCSNIAPKFFGIPSIDSMRHPPLTPLGINQAISLNIFLRENIIKKGYNNYYCSPSLRTIMTALFSLRNIEYDYELIITPWISEHLNYMGNFDNQNNIVKPDNLRVMIKYIKNWMQTDYFNLFIDSKFFIILIQIHKFINNIMEGFVSEESVKDIDIADVMISIKNFNNIVSKLQDTRNNILAKNILNKDKLYEYKFDQGEFNIDFTVKDVILYIDRIQLRIIKIMHNRTNQNVFVEPIDFDEFLLLYNELNMFQDSNFLRGPPINLEYYDSVYMKAIVDTDRSISYYNNFFNQIVKNELNTRILVFTHGNAIKTINKIDSHPLNTSVYESIYTYYKMNSIITDKNTDKLDTTLIYCPPREYYKSKEKCDLESKDNTGLYVNPIINKKEFVVDTCNPEVIGDLFNKSNDMFNNNYPKDVDTIIRAKYLKYKQKYLELKLKHSKI